MRSCKSIAPSKCYTLCFVFSFWSYTSLLYQHRIYFRSWRTAWTKECSSMFIRFLHFLSGKVYWSCSISICCPIAVTLENWSATGACFVRRVGPSSGGPSFHSALATCCLNVTWTMTISIYTYIHKSHYVQWYSTRNEFFTASLEVPPFNLLLPPLYITVSVMCRRRCPPAGLPWQS